MFFLSNLLSIVQRTAKHLSKAAVSARLDNAVSTTVLASANLVESASNILESQFSKQGGRGG